MQLITDSDLEIWGSARYAGNFCEVKDRQRVCSELLAARKRIRELLNTLELYRSQPAPAPCNCSNVESLKTTIDEEVNYLDGRCDKLANQMRDAELNIDSLREQVDGRAQAVTRHHHRITELESRIAGACDYRRLDREQRLHVQILDTHTDRLDAIEKWARSIGFTPPQS